MEPDVFCQMVMDIENEIGKVMVGQREIIRHTLIGLLAGGNILLEGVPGLGKTLLVKTVSEALSLDFNRIQFTPDLMPADIVGTNIISEDQQGGKHFQFQAGPVFANIILADEINRATPKTQSAMLEAMQEQTVTAGGKTRELPQPFFVLATQNPLEMEGTYPLPEAQMDRFLFKLLVNFPPEEELVQIINLTTGVEASRVQTVAGAETIMQMQELARQVPVSERVTSLAVRVMLATHPDSDYAPERAKKYVRYGASPRGGQALIAAGKVRALAEGRFNVAFEDIKELAYPALRHRFFLNFEGQAEGLTTDDLIADILEHIKYE